MEGAGLALVNRLGGHGVASRLPHPASLHAQPPSPGLGWDENVPQSRRYTAPMGKCHIKQQWDVLQNATLVGSFPAHLIQTPSFIGTERNPKKLSDWSKDTQLMARTRHYHQGLLIFQYTIQLSLK